MTHPAPVAWYRHLNHTSDLGCEVLGNTQSELFAHAGQALFSLLIPLEQVEERDTVPINVSGIDLIDLWVTFLRELLYLVNGRHFLVHTVVIDSSMKRHYPQLFMGSHGTRHVIACYEKSRQ